MGLSEFANFELGEAFFEITNAMIVHDGIPFSRVGDFDIVSPSWRKLADKPDKTPDEIKKLDNDYKNEIRDLADSCIFYMGARLNTKNFEFNLEDYKKFMQLVNVLPNNSSDLEAYNKKIEIQFKKIANHGEVSGDNIIDNKDFAAYIYALDLKSDRKDDKFNGFILNGKITPMNFALAYNQLKDDADNMISLKLRQAYKNLFE